MDGSTPNRTTLHARRRVKERIKLPHRAAKRMAQLALERGLHPDDPSLTPPQRAKIERSRRANYEQTPNAQYRVYHGCLWVFNGVGSLLTIIPDFDHFNEGGRPPPQHNKRWFHNEIRSAKRNRRPRNDDAPGYDYDDE